MANKNEKYDLDSVELKFKTHKDEQEVLKTESLRPDWIEDDDLLIRNTKKVVTIRIDEDILQAIKKFAKKKNIKYQTLINDYLRKSFVNKGKESLLIEQLMERIEKLERIYKTRMGL